MIKMCKSGNCKICGKGSIMFSYIGKGYLCLEHYSKMIASVKIVEDKKMSENKWKYACTTCSGKGYEEKLSCGCTGYRMRRQCRFCDGKGTVDLITHNIQANKQREFLKCCKDFSKNKQNFLG